VENGLRSHAETLVDDVKAEWKMLWRDRYDDKVKAEAMANRDFSLLFVERGTVIVATRAFKPLDLRSILECHKVDDVNRVVSPHPSVGGWGKFSRTVLTKQSRARVYKQSVPCRSHTENLQVKKGGRGWLHRRMNR
jgi:hypothetical protein